MNGVKAKKLILSRGLPKTGSTIETGLVDDGSFEAGWWKGLKNSNNKARFVPQTIGGDDVVIDRATGLMWAADGNAAGCNGDDSEQWGDADQYASNLSFAGFSDWRIPNINELGSIIDYGEYSPAINSTFFPNTGAGNYWSSTTYVQNQDYGFCVEFEYGDIVRNAKSEGVKLRCVRGGL